MTKHYDIYTDGSYLNGIWGSGAIIIYDNEIIKEIKTSGKDINGIRNIAGEINAVLESLRYLYKELKDTLSTDSISITIHHDYIGLQKWADFEWQRNKSETISYAESIKKAREFFTIDFNKVKAHSNNYYNDYVDSLAKESINEYVEE